MPRLRLNLGSQQAALHYARELLSGNQKARSSHAHCWPLSAHWSAHPTLPTVRARTRRLCTLSSRAAPYCFVHSRSQGPTALPGYSSPEGWLSAESPGLDERRQQLQVRREGTSFLADSRQRTPGPVGAPALARQGELRSRGALYGVCCVLHRLFPGATGTCLGTAGQEGRDPQRLPEPPASRTSRCVMRSVYFATAVMPVIPRIATNQQILR